MAVSNPSGLTITQVYTGIQYSKVTDSSSDWPSVANDTYFYDKTDKLIYYKNTQGTILSIFSLGLNSAGSNYGLYTQTASSTPITNTTTESSLLNGGLGSLSVPANGFQVGDSFQCSMTGHISSVNNETLQIRIKSNGSILADTGVLTMPQTTIQHWRMNVNFIVRAIGGSGVASIATGGSFSFNKDASNSIEGTSFSVENNTTFNTTILNTLAITAQWGSSNVGNSIYSDIFTLNKIY